MTIATARHTLQDEMTTPALKALAVGIRRYEPKGVCLLDLPVETIGVNFQTFVNPEPTIGDVHVSWVRLNQEPPIGVEQANVYREDSFILRNRFVVETYQIVDVDATSDPLTPQLHAYGEAMAQSFDDRYGPLTADMMIFQGAPLDIVDRGVDPCTGAHVNHTLNWIVRVGKILRLEEVNPK